MYSLLPSGWWRISWHRPQWSWSK